MTDALVKIPTVVTRGSNKRSLCLRDPGVRKALVRQDAPFEPGLPIALGASPVSETRQRRSAVGMGVRRDVGTPLHLVPGESHRICTSPDRTRMRSGLSLAVAEVPVFAGHLLECVAMRHIPLMLVGGLVLVVTRSANAANRGEEVERVVAVIRSPASKVASVITRSRLEEETRIALISHGATLAASQPLDRAALKAGLDWLVDETLLNDEAERLQVFEIDGAAGRGELARFQARFARAVDYQSFLERCGLIEAELEVVLRRMLRVRRYVESRVSRAAQVSEAETSMWFDRHAAEVGVRDRKLARARLAEERVKSEVRGLARDLRSRAEVRILDERLRQAAPVRGADGRG